MSLKSAKQPNFQMAYECLIDEVSKEYKRHAYIFFSNSLFEKEKNDFMNIINKEAKESEYAKSIQFLSQCLEKHHKKKTIILIDEVKAIRTKYKIWAFCFCFLQDILKK